MLNALGPTGLKVSALGVGAMHINNERTSDAAALREAFTRRGAEWPGLI
ncbi:MAG: hypothetical protein ACT6RP_02745 [Roseateles sp.]